ncbi:MAG: MerR family transcriptional regulator [Candidatus Accumulibacter sp.]|jgi:DNA-binding transcriptional MerR regulator|nr:MerR family transcriptional regulator [Accumulibacter sp.]
MERNPKDTPRDPLLLIPVKPKKTPRDSPGDPLPPIPAKRYFTIGEVSELCGVKPHVLRYWEQEFTQLKPVKRRGNRRYYQHHEVLLVRRIRELLYNQGFTISGARNRLEETIEESHEKTEPTPESIRSELLDIVRILKGETE